MFKKLSLRRIFNKFVAFVQFLWKSSRKFNSHIIIIVVVKEDNIKFPCSRRYSPHHTECTLWDVTPYSPAEIYKYFGGGEWTLLFSFHSYTLKMQGQRGTNGEAYLYQTRRHQIPENST
jgi:hypothetical protein